MLFLIDGSESISRSDFDRVRNWTLRTVDRFSPSTRENPLFVTVVQFSEIPKIEVNKVKVTISSAQIALGVKRMKQMRKTTNTYSALDFVNQIVPVRKNSKKILITITDGDASDNRSSTVVQKAHVLFDVMISVAVGNSLNMTQLEDFSSNGTSPSIIRGFSALEDTIPEIYEKVCFSIENR